VVTAADSGYILAIDRYPTSEDWIKIMVASSLTVGILGAGRVGAVLGAALERAGHRVVAASGVSAASPTASAACCRTPGPVPADQVAAASIS
jgi:predicted short-subunit dehydrogenase-like oxidoreductase (DUF2520 family)